MKKAHESVERTSNSIISDLDDMAKQIIDITGMEKKHLIDYDHTDITEPLFHLAILSGQADQAEQTGPPEDAALLKVHVYNRFRTKFPLSSAIPANFGAKLAHYKNIHLRFVTLSKTQKELNEINP